MLSEAFLQAVGKSLAAAQLGSASGRAFATPRRLAVSIPDVASEAADRESELSGPSTKAPEQAVAGFARKAGIPVARLERRSTPKGEIYVARVCVKGAALDEALAAIVEDALKGDDPRIAGNWWDDLRSKVIDWKDERIEGLTRGPGGGLWKQIALC